MKTIRTIPQPKVGIVPTIARAIGKLARHSHMKRSWLNAIGYMSAYNATDPDRLFLEGFLPRNATSDQTLNWNLTNLVAMLRQLERNNPSVKGLVEGWMADVVGTGIDVEPDTGDEKLNARIREEWQRWCECCTPCGKTLWEMQAQAMVEWCTGGGHFWRDTIIASRVDQDQIPYCMMPVEIEWLTLLPIKPIGKDSYFTRGIELDNYGRPIAYHVMDYNLLNQQGLSTAWGGPGDVVPASQMIHGYQYRRPRQAHGEPLLSNVVERTYQDGKLVDVELKSSIAGSAVSGVIKTIDLQDWNSTRAVTDQYGNITGTTQTAPVVEMQPGVFARLTPGEDVTIAANPRPSQQIAPFRKGIRGDMAAGACSSQQWLDRDLAGVTYSSMRGDELITERIRKPKQQVFARYVATMPYERALPWILLKLGIVMPTNAAVKRQLFRHKLMFDRPKYVDPEKDSKAADFQVKNGLSTIEEECAARGKDYRKIREQRQKEVTQADQDTVARMVAIATALRAAKAANPELESVNVATVLAVGGAATAPGAFLAAANQPTGDDEPAAQPSSKGAAA